MQPSLGLQPGMVKGSGNHINREHLLADHRLASSRNSVSVSMSSFPEKVCFYRIPAPCMKDDM